MEAVCDEGDIVLVEDPTHLVFLSIRQSRGIQARGVRLERDGMDLVQLEKVLTRLKISGELRHVKAVFTRSPFPLFPPVEKTRQTFVRSTRRPGQATSAEDVAVQVRHGFAAVRTVVDDEPVTALQIQLFSNFGSLEQEMAEQFVVVRRGFGDANHGFFRKDQNVRWRLRIDVAYGEDGIVFKNNLGRDFAGDDFFKQGFHGALIFSFKFLVQKTRVLWSVST